MEEDEDEDEAEDDLRSDVLVLGSMALLLLKISNDVDLSRGKLTMDMMMFIYIMRMKGYKKKLGMHKCCNVRTGEKRGKN